MITKNCGVLPRTPARNVKERESPLGGFRSSIECEIKSKE
jgi:hypothetical protein